MLLYSAIWLLALLTLVLVPVTVLACVARNRSGVRRAKNRPVLLVACIIATIGGYYWSGKFTQDHAVPDFLGFDIGKAMFWSSLPASSIALSTGLLSILRCERFLPLSIGVCVLTALWFASSLILSAHASKFLLEPLANSEQSAAGKPPGSLLSAMTFLISNPHLAFHALPRPEAASA